MNEKGVYVRIGERNKFIQFRVQEGKTDWDCVRSSLHKSAERDLNLAAILKGSDIIFQREKTKKNGTKIYVDVEESEEKEIVDEEDIKAVLCVHPNLSNVTRKEPEPQEIKENLINYTSLDIPIMNEELCLQFLLEKENAGNIDLSPSPSQEEEPTPENNVVNPTVNNEDVRQRSFFKPLKKLPQFSGKKEDLPSLPSTLRSFIDAGMEKKKQSKFIAFYGRFAMSWRERPTKRDYDLLSSAICERHPSFKALSGGRPHGIVSSCLSIYIRNHRTRLNAEVKSLLIARNENDPGTSKMDIPPEPKKKKDAAGPKISVDSLLSPKNEAEEALVKNMERELKAKEHIGATLRILYLMKGTFLKRRDWIAKLPANSGAAAVTLQYPHLLLFDIILQEFQLMVGTPLQTLEDRLAKLLQALGHYMDAPVITNEEAKANIFLKLHEKLKPAKFSKKIIDVLMLRKIHGDGYNIQDEFSTEMLDAPRLIVFTGDNGNIVSSFVVADAVVEMKISATSFEHCLLGLVACYHAWDVEYPPEYKNSLNFIDEYVCNVKTSYRSVTLQVFRRDFEQWLQNTDFVGIAQNLS